MTTIAELWAAVGEATADNHAVGDSTGELHALRRRRRALHYAGDDTAAHDTAAHDTAADQAVSVTDERLAALPAEPGGAPSGCGR
jgi:hypothetical protein